MSKFEMACRIGSEVMPVVYDEHALSIAYKQVSEINTVKRRPQQSETISRIYTKKLVFEEKCKSETLKIHDKFTLRNFVRE